MAQLVARFVRNEEARGSNPLSSTADQGPIPTLGNRPLIVDTAARYSYPKLSPSRFRAPRVALLDAWA